MHITVRSLVSLPTLIVLLLCNACDSQRANPEWTAPGSAGQPGRGVPAEDPVAAPASAPALPAPASLAGGKVKQTRYVEADLLKNGADFDLALPNLLVTADGAEVDFSSSGPGNGLTGGSYCIYRFSISGYDRNAQIRADWATAADDGLIYFGMANWGSNRWDWFHGSADPKLNLPTIAPYFHPQSSELLLVVLCAGEAQRLTSLRIGGQPPTASQTLNRNSGFVPINCRFDASASADPDGSIAAFDWDLDGDGFFETDNGLEPVLDHSFEQAGFFPATLRVTDDDGLIATAKSNFTACAEWAHSLGSPEQDSIAAVGYDGRGAIYVTGAGGQDVLLARYDLAGNLVWARTWDSGVNEDASELAFDAAGNVLLCGLCDFDLGDGRRQSLLVQTWSPAGELLSSRYCVNSLQFFPAAVLLTADHAFVLGSAESFSTLGLLDFRLDTGDSDGIKAWTFDGGTDITIKDITAHAIFVFGGGIAIDATAVGFYSPGFSDSAIAVHFDNDSDPDSLDLDSAQQLGLSGSIASAVLKRGSLLTETVICGSYQDGSDRAVFISNLKPDSEPSFFWSSGSSSCFVSGMAQKTGGDLTVVGNRQSDSGLWLRYREDGFAGKVEQFLSPSSAYFINSNLSSIAGICGVCGGQSGLPTAEFSVLENSSGPATYSWSPLSLTPVSVDSASFIDLPGAVDVNTDLLLDAVAGSGEAFLLSHQL